ncbi:MAG: ABC transporter ATP-binding protein [Eubacteriales bacterium]|nr:ABC transporter ATP-binding protein [Eubacteriales bacterium]
MMKRFVSYYRPVRGIFALDMFCAFASAALGLVFPLVTRRILNVTIPQGNLRELWMLAAALLGIYLAMALLSYFMNYQGHVMGVRMEAHIREDLFTHLQKLSFKYYDDNRTGKIMSRMLNDLFDVTELAHHGPEDIFISLVMLVGSCFVLFRIEWRLTLLILAVMPLLVWFATTRRKKMGQAFVEVRGETASINAQIENSISGIRVVQSFTNEDYECERFHDGNRRFQAAKSKSYRAMSTFMSGMGFLTNVANAVVIIGGGFFIYLGEMTLTDLITFNMFITLILQPVQRLTNFTQQFEQGMSGFKRFAEVMEMEPQIVDAPDAHELKDVHGSIELRDVTFRYNDDEDVLNHVSLTIPAGRTVALVGPSGGGKTTLCQLIPRFYDVLEGEVLVDGHNVKELTLRSLRDAIGSVQQDVFLFTGTIRENILYGNVNATDEQVIEAAKEANIHEFILSCPEGYDTYIGEKGVRLSGGQKQRLSIARAFLKNPPILILDEATSALDNETERKVQQALFALSRGRTTLVIAHRLSTIKNADEIIVLTDEGVKEQGSHETLYAQGGIYTRLYDAQFKEVNEKGEADVYRPQAAQD